VEDVERGGPPRGQDGGADTSKRGHQGRRGQLAGRDRSVLIPWSDRTLTNAQPKIDPITSPIAFPTER
jgi:hypothetical protein